MRRLAELALSGLAVAVAATGAMPRARAGTDWTTYAYDLQRTGYNPRETAIGTGNVGALALQWSASIGGPIVTQPLVATGVATASGTRDLVYVAARYGTLGIVAVDRGTGAIVWHNALGSHGTSRDLGTIGTPTLDRARHAVYVATRGDDLHALDEATGAELAGWPVHVTPATLTNGQVFSALTLVGSRVYVEVANGGDQPPYRGEAIRVDVTSRTILSTWFPTGASGPYGGGIWGMGGLSVEPDGSALYAATGNALGNNEHYRYAEHVVRLSPALKPQAANYPGLSGSDVDFGATPLLYQAKGCPAQLAAMNKSGALFVYDRGAIASGPRQRLQVASQAFASEGNFIGLPAFSPVSGLLYVNNPSDSSAGTYKHGLVALRVGAGCQLGLAWQRVVGGQSTATTIYPSISPTVANGVVYVARSVDSTVYAFDASSGKPLWSSGGQVTGGVFAAVTVANGQLLIASDSGTLYAFMPPSPAR